MYWKLINDYRVKYKNQIDKHHNNVEKHSPNKKSETMI